MLLFPKLVRNLLDEDDLVRLDSLMAYLLWGPSENTGSALRTPSSQSRKQLERRPTVVRQRIGWEERGFPHMVLALSSEVQTIMCWDNSVIKSLISFMCVSAINLYIYHLSLYLTWRPFLLPPIVLTPLNSNAFSSKCADEISSVAAGSKPAKCVCMSGFSTHAGVKAHLVWAEGQMLSNFTSNVKVKP